MDQKPSDFFVGVIDFFAILLPGALLSYAYMDLARADVLGKILPAADGDARGLALFIFASYLLGHFIFLLGSELDFLYDSIRGRFYGDDNPVLECALGIKNKYLVVEPRFRINRSVVRKLKLEGVPPEILELLAGMKKHDPKSKEEFLKCIKDLPWSHGISDHEPLILKKAEVTVINAFQWAKANIELRSPAAAVEVHRLEADSKFFRSLMVVIVLISPIVIYNAALSHEAVGITLVVSALFSLLVLSFLRYLDRRRKGIKLAYYYLIALEKVAGIESTSKAALSTDNSPRKS